MSERPTKYTFGLATEVDRSIRASGPAAPMVAVVDVRKLERLRDVVPVAERELMLDVLYLIEVAQQRAWAL